MSETYLVSFATKDFEPSRRRMEQSALKFGIYKFHSYTTFDLKKTFYFYKRKEIFRYKRGFGLWLWKPYIILKSLEKLNDGDILLYVDAGCEFINDPSSLISLARNNASGIVAFDCRPLQNKQFVKRKTFINMDCDNHYHWDNHHVIATVILFKKCQKTILFVKEWLRECEVVSSLLPEIKEPNDDNFSDFIAHREDQSILSLLVSKYNLETYRNPSKWGNFLKMEQYRETGELICYPYYLKNTTNSYCENPMLNSTYGTIFEFNNKISGNPFINPNPVSFIKRNLDRLIIKITHKYD